MKGEEAGSAPFSPSVPEFFFFFTKSQESGLPGARGAAPVAQSPAAHLFTSDLPAGSKCASKFFPNRSSSCRSTNQEP